MARGAVHVACSLIFVLLASDALENWWCTTSDGGHSHVGISGMRLAAAQSPSKAGVAKKPPQPDDVANSFIRASGNVFVDDSCREYLYTGWNGWNEMLLAGLQVPAPKTLAAAPALLAAQSDFATGTFREAAQAKLKVARFFAAGGDRQNIQLQLEPGKYNETVFRGIDYILAQAGRFKIKLVLSIINNWDDIDGKGQYTRWAGVQSDDFWTNSRVRTIYKNHLKALTSRVNVFTGVAYKKDPTIFSWNLYNEPRNPDDDKKGPGEPAPVTAWVNEMSAVLAALDTNHMITVGEEGFFPDNSPYTKYNPAAANGEPTPGWAEWAGQDFIAQHSSPNISYAAIHYWPNDWNAFKPEVLPMWIEGHISAAKTLKKPLVLEEFGIVAATQPNPQLPKIVASRSAAASNISETRDPIYRQIYQYVETGVEEKGPLRAALFWEWSRTNRSSGNSVLSTDSTFAIIKAHAALLAARPTSVQPGCKPRVSAAAGATPVGKKGASSPASAPAPGPSASALSPKLGLEGMAPGGSPPASASAGGASDPVRGASEPAGKTPGAANTAAVPAAGAVASSATSAVATFVVAGFTTAAAWSLTI